MYKGIGASAGIGIGKIVVIKEQELNYSKTTITDKEAEKKRLADAIDVFIEKTTALAESMKVTAGEAESEILEGHIMMIQDPAIKEQIETKIDEESINAESAVEEACDFFAMIFSMAEDELTQQRASDLGDIKTRLIKILLGVEDVDISAVPAETILVAEDLTPSMTAGIVPANVEGVLTEIGGKTSHSAIICRSMEIPAVLSIPEITKIVKDGDVVVLDGTTGDMYLNPDEDVLAEYKAKRDAYLEAKAALAKFVGKPSQTADGHVVELVANIGGPDEAPGVLERDGEGVGLFRTEFLFMDSNDVPSEESQFEAYKKVAETLEGKPVIIRTLDIGGDKALPYLGLPTEENPFLGFRAVRFCLKRPDIYKPQLRALLRASAYGKIRIMVPLVTCVDELRAVKALIAEIKADLDAEGIAYDKDIKVGVMMETAAASLIADILAKEADFFSIGTNDLTGYTMAADRGNPDVAYLYSAYNPAVLRSIRNIIAAANKEDIMAGMCGEAASDPLMIPLLLAFGLNEFSVSATAILQARKTMSLWTMEECKALADEVMQLSTEAEVKALLEERARS
jgi:phosphotransferase system enzyme I (PtsI)